jgi:hypothetical protein
MATLALILTLLLNGGAVAPVTAEDSPIVPVMGAVAVATLIEAHPECEGPTSWDFNRDESDGLSVYGFAENCEYAASFYLSPDTGRWTFLIEGA